MKATGRDGYIAWMRSRAGRDCFAPFTGQDMSAFHAWMYLLELYFRADGPGQRRTIAAMHYTLSAMQPKCWPVAKAAIPCVGDDSHEDPLWAEITREFLEAG